MDENLPRRIVVLSDGTFSSKDKPDLSTIGLLEKHIVCGPVAGWDQRVTYDNGIGIEDSNLFARYRAATFGYGIDENIQQLYEFIAKHYRPGDEIYCFGFSRGAYTVRSLAGLINEAGLLRPDNISPEKIKEAYELYRRNRDLESDSARAFRDENGDRVPITLVGCFETVGSLGMPRFIPFQGIWNRRYEFHDTTLSSIIQNGIHALGIDERVSVLSPTPMTPSRDGQVTEKWFPGGHGDVGGSTNQALSNIALKFMIGELANRGLGLVINSSEIPDGNPLAPLDGGNFFMRFVTGPFREIPSFDDLHSCVKVRYAGVPDWRPENLEAFTERFTEPEQSQTTSDEQ
eukprot:Plantae.Rhodophyta-Rhodochaete_pulchella.ctg5346.p1 GENE.Plantae.Rhodophyta-Rhodochaete_pulchella.ctg5346~~Plantae.Rhodophyta-Rhodochaete_pulchella.ctg5346.p1  ORF type:complete len:359 (+),score=44.87 Plantae.Rhodophyta-Rhodochaete_pulchella.ctg5346:40-1077(+)